jgi:hypothetical protein
MGETTMNKRDIRFWVDLNCPKDSAFLIPERKVNPDGTLESLRDWAERTVLIRNIGETEKQK